ncbi:MAG: cytochrome ubiquinol oxidase subunit I [Phycisphaerales bacterium]|nr:MAG: cytochrome ubiquinol oxidase subunit I [Phycisphaerales bacterium]
MDALFLSRLQFAITPFIHFLFVPVTIGLALMIALMETVYARTGNAEYQRMAKFWGKLFLINFAAGIVTGIVLEFQFGTNWARYSQYVGDIFGSLLAIEATGFFFLESTMIGVWIFGWKRLSPWAHATVMWLVALAACGSAFWILTANAWMQNPVGYQIRNGRAELVDLWAVVLNPTAILSILHTISASIALSAFFVLGISAYHLRANRETAFFGKSFRIALVAGTVFTLAVVAAGDFLGANVAGRQPAKLAAMESHWKTSTRAPMTIVVWPDEENETNLIEFGRIPGALSFLAFKDFDREVIGLADIPRDERPPVAITMVSFRMMVAIGTAMLGLLALSWLRLRQLQQTPLLLTTLIWFIPLPFIACNVGWILTEVGRQPWIVYNVMRTSEGVTEGLRTYQVGFSLISLTVLLTLVTAATAFLIVRHARRGPLPLEGSNEPAKPDSAG